MRWLSPSLEEIVEIGNKYGFKREMDELKSKAKSMRYIFYLFTLMIIFISSIVVLKEQIHLKVSSICIASIFVLFLFAIILIIAYLGTSTSKWNIHITGPLIDAIFLGVIVLIFLLWIYTAYFSSEKELPFGIILGTEALLFVMMLVLHIQFKKIGFLIEYKFNKKINSDIEKCIEATIFANLKIEKIEKEKYYKSIACHDGLSIFVMYPVSDNSTFIRIQSPFNKEGIEKSFKIAKELEERCGF